MTYCWRRVRSAGTTEAAELIAAVDATLRANGSAQLDKNLIHERLPDDAGR